MKNVVNIALVEDAVCSWCPVGYFNLKRALAILGDDLTARIRFLPFELNPTMGPEGERVVPHLTRKYGLTEAQVLATREKLIALGREASVTFDFTKRTHYYNTFKAHCLARWATDQGRHIELHEALIRAYFTDGVDISNRERLVELCTEAGLDASAAAAAFDSKSLEELVRADQAFVRGLGITSIPTYLVDGKVLTSGAQPVQILVDLLRRYAA